MINVPRETLDEMELVREHFLRAFDSVIDTFDGDENKSMDMIKALRYMGLNWDNEEAQMRATKPFEQLKIYC